MSMAVTTPTTVRLKEKNREYVEQFAKLTKRSQSHIMNEAIENFIPERMAYLEELNRSVAEAKQGKNYSAEDVFAWMDTWGTEDEKPLKDMNFSPSQSRK